MATETDASGAPAQHGSIPYRADIDGIRAVAVVLVVLYHAGVPGFTGGYVGVDVFFTLSGFLITSVIVAQTEAHRFSLIGFFAGRVRRLLPLSLLTLTTTVAFGIWLLPSTRAVELIGDARSAVFYVANWRFGSKAVAYVDTDVADGMLTHYWSLSVEEQFYFVWPLLLVGAAFIAQRNRRWSFRTITIGIAAVVSIASLAASTLWTSSGGSAAYYATHLRLWEISLGALLAAVGATLPFGRSIRSLIQSGSLGLIVVAAFRFDDFTPYPGTAALLPVIPTLALLAAGDASSRVGELLSSRPLRYLGEHSFAIYLWHWPALGISALLFDRYGVEWSEWQRIAIALAVAISLSHLSHAVVENPIRFSPQLRRLAVPSIAAAAICMAGFAVAGRMAENVVVSASARDWSEALVSPTEAVADTASVEFNSCHKGMAQGSAGETAAFCVGGDPDGDRTIVLVGDSHGQHWDPAFDEAGKLNGWRVLVTSRSACLTYDIASFNARLEVLDDGCRRWGRAVEQAIAAEADVDLVVVARARGYFQTIRADDGSQLSDAEVEDALHRAALGFLETTLETGASVILMEDTPWAPFVVPDCLLTVTPRTARQCDFAAVTTDLEVPLLRAEKAAVAATGSSRDAVVSFDDLVCPGGECAAVDPDGLITFRDRHHLTATFSRSLGAPVGDLLRPFLR